MSALLCCAAAACLALLPCSAASAAFTESGEASWYGPWHHGKTTANGDAFDMVANTAAHKTVPLGTLIRVRSAKGGRSIIVRVNDRGPYYRDRILDLSYGAADRLGIDGVGMVSIEAVSDKRGRLLDRSSRLYVRLGMYAPAPGDVDRSLGRLIRTGMYEAMTLLRKGMDSLALGPYESFTDAQSALVRIGTIFPEASIMLARESEMPPASPVPAD
ncbi:MAG: septal ring lytic transglycosylase RlpA family protein [Mailhella sp.]|nr:septal ring lytic transglycosylase RlpA family protein [Mailhella sp.]